MRAQEVFVNPREGRLRAGWRLALHGVLLAVSAAIVFVVFGLAAGLVLRGQASDAASMLFGTAANCIAITVSVFLARRWLDRRSLASLGLGRSHAARDFLFGLTIAAAMLGLIYAAEAALGWLRFQGFGWRTGAPQAWLMGMLGWLVVFLMVGWYEELLSRGYWLVNLSDGLNRLLAALLTSAAFALLHRTNPNASWISTAGLFCAGLWFAFAALRSGNLWLPIGAHIAWNICEGMVFGFPVSGLDTPRAILQSPTGPVLWTGGAFGPEAGLIVLPALLLGALAVWLYTRGPTVSPT
jgi:uncharacterized protein